MKPITFACAETLPLPAADVARHILDLEKWSEFRGYGPIPGIRSAVFATQTPDVVGTRIQVTNRDGSSHVEEIVEWQPERRVRLRLADFSPPLARLATAFEETWEFEPVEGGTRVTRSFALQPRSRPARLLLRVIAFFLRRAIARQLQEMKARS